MAKVKLTGLVPSTVIWSTAIVDGFVFSSRPWVGPTSIELRVRVRVPVSRGRRRLSKRARFYAKARNTVRIRIDNMGTPT